MNKLINVNPAKCVKSVRMGGRMYEKCKNIDLNEIQRSNE